MKEVEAVVSVCGDYCAFHEMMLTVDYVYGDNPIIFDVLEGMDELENLSDEDIKKMDKNELDKKVKEYINSFDDSGDYCDYKNAIVLEYKGKYYYPLR